MWSAATKTFSVSSGFDIALRHYHALKRFTLVVNYGGLSPLIKQPDFLRFIAKIILDAANDVPTTAVIIMRTHLTGDRGRRCYQRFLTIVSNSIAPFSIRYLM